MSDLLQHPTKQVSEFQDTYHRTVLAVVQLTSAAASKNSFAFSEVRTATTCSDVNVFSVVSDWSIINVLPVTISTIAIKSYFQMNFSPRHVIERIALTMMPVDEFAVRRVRSAKGKMPTFEF